MKTSPGGATGKNVKIKIFDLKKFQMSDELEIFTKGTSIYQTTF